MNTRRSFLKEGSFFGLATVLAPVIALGSTKDYQNPENVLNKNDAEDVRKFTILYTSDIHAQLNPHDEFFWENEKAVYRKRGGMAHLKTMIEYYRSQNPENTILIDGGDFIHGSAVASLTEGEALIPVMNWLNYDLILPGNWEVVYKKEKMLYDMGHVTAAKLCANMYHDTQTVVNGELIYPPFWIKYIAGIKVGFIGYTDPLIPKRQSPDYSKGMRFTNPVFNVARYIKQLREEEGCSIVLLITHTGLAQEMGLANDPAVAGVDLILGADTHERVRKIIKGKYTDVIECGAFGSFLGKIDFTIEQGKLKDIKYALLDVDPGKFPADKKMDEIIHQIYKPFKKDLSKIIGYTRTPLVRYFVKETPMDNLITDAIYWKFKPDIALSNGFRFCQPLAVNPSEEKRAIDKEFLWNMLPVNNEAKMGSVTGQQLWAWLEKELENAFAKDFAKRFGGWFVRFKGMQVNFTIGKEFGKKLNWVKIGGEPIDLQKTYRIIACEREGDPDTELCRVTGVKDTTKTGYTMHTIIEEYLAEKGTVAPKLEGRATATDEPDTLLTQVKGIDYEFR